MSQAHIPLVLPAHKPIAIRQAIEAAGLLPGTRIRVTGRRRNPPVLEVEVEGSNAPALEVNLAVARRVFVIPAVSGEGRADGT